MYLTLKTDSAGIIKSYLKSKILFAHNGPRTVCPDEEIHISLTQIQKERV